MLRDRTKIAMVMAEFLGTGIFVLTAMSVMANFGNSIFVALVAGLAAASVYMVFSRISGGHFNPAITLGMLTTRRIPLFLAVVYIAAQLLGAMVAYALYTYLMNQNIKPNTHFSSRILVSEAVGALVFSLGWASAVYNRYNTARAAFTIGGSLAIGIMVASFANTGFVNPALALGMQSWGWGTYVLGPVLGAVIGFNLYALLFAPATALVADEESAEDAADEESSEAALEIAEEAAAVVRTETTKAVRPRTGRRKK